jgi:hypothetical protein
MSETLPFRPSLNNLQNEKLPSLGSFPASGTSAHSNGLPRLSPSPSFVKRSPSNSRQNLRRQSGEQLRLELGQSPRPRRYKSQYPLNSPERHVEYILVASFHIDRGPIMEHQYPIPISGDESMLAELMLPDQTHVRSQDWTIFFLHKDSSDEEEEAEAANKKRKGKRKQEHPNGDAEGDDPEEDSNAETEDEESSDEEDEGGEGPPLMYVLNLVNTKQDNTVRRYASFLQTCCA